MLLMEAVGCSQTCVMSRFTAGLIHCMLNKAEPLLATTWGRPDYTHLTCCHPGSGGVPGLERSGSFHQTLLTQVPTYRHSINTLPANYFSINHVIHVKVTDKVDQTRLTDLPFVSRFGNGSLCFFETLLPPLFLLSPRKGQVCPSGRGREGAW